MPRRARFLPLRDVSDSVLDAPARVCSRCSAALAGVTGLGATISVCACARSTTGGTGGDRGGVRLGRIEGKTGSGVVAVAHTGCPPITSPKSETFVSTRKVLASAARVAVSRCSSHISFGRILNHLRAEHTIIVAETVVDRGRAGSQSRTRRSWASSGRLWSSRILVALLGGERGRIA